MKTIRYEITLEHGLKAIAGEPVEIANDQGMTFGVHCTAYRAFDDELRYIVTHVESGLLVGNGVTRGAAIESARVRIDKARLSGALAHVVERAMQVRAEVLATNPVVFG